MRARSHLPLAPDLLCSPPTCVAIVIVVATLSLAMVPAATFASGATPGTGDRATGHDEMTMPDRAPTAAERSAASALVTAVRSGVARLADPEVAAREGYVQSTPFAFYGLRAAHFHNETYNQDGKLLDPERPEDLMYLKHDDGSLELIGVMFLAPPGDGPAIGGPLTHWHVHNDLCGGPDGVVAKAPDGACPADTYPITFEMLHVWLIDAPDGPFADRPTAGTATTLVGAGNAHNSLVAGDSLIDSEGLMRAVGSLLQLDPTVIAHRYAAGESLAKMAATQGVDRASLVRVMTDWLTTDFTKSTARGDMTAAQRDLLIRNLPVQVERMVAIHPDEPWVPGSGSSPGATPPA
jgi:hypothetical protein